MLKVVIYCLNCRIKYLNLCMNGFEEEGTRALETMVTENHTLLELDVSFCRIPVCGPILKMSSKNKSV